MAIPTETVYGLAGNAYNEVAVGSIFTAKGRPSFDPLIVHTNDIVRICEFVEDFNSVMLKLATHCWPGPLTLLLKKNKHIPDIVTSGSPYVGVRIPRHSLARALLAVLPFPLAAPSANPFGYISPTAAVHVNDQLGGKIPYILDGGNCEVGIESTIVGFEGGMPTIYRLGGISVTKIEEIIGPVAVALQHAPLEIRAPGTLERHYSPKKPFKVGNITTLIEEHKGKQIGVLAFKKYHPKVSKRFQVILSPKGNLDEAATHFFAALRELDKMPIDLIVASYMENSGIGLAMNDRLKRASNT